MGAAAAPRGKLAGAGEPAAAAWRALGCDIRLLVTDPEVLPTAQALLAADLAALDLAASRFRADSEVSAIHRAGGRPIRISPVLADCIAVSMMAAEISSGDLDPTMGSDLFALGYDRTFAEVAGAGRGAGAAASSAAGLRPANRVGVSVRHAPNWADVELDRAAGTVRVPAGVILDLGATAKARCADLAAARISAECGTGVLVSLGGDIAVAGQAPAGGWVVRVQDVTGDPELAATGSPTCLVALSAGGMATSSTAARRWRNGGSVLHHILDPRTGRPADDTWRTVTVAAQSCLLANIASTTAIIRGTSARSWLAELGLPARLIPRTQGRTQPEVVLLGGWPTQEEREWTP